MKAVILDYNTKSVCVETIPKDIEKDYYDIEEWLSIGCGYNLADAYWMVVDDNRVPVFYGCEQEPTYVL